MEAGTLTLQIPSMVSLPFYGGRPYSKENESSLVDGNGNVDSIKIRKRPTMLVLPEYCPEKEFILEKRKIENVEVEINDRDYVVLSKKGTRENMEDRFKVITHVFGDPKQAFFSVIDGHGGVGAADYVADNLGNNILNSLQNHDGQRVEEAIREGYLNTDKDFLTQGVSSGACAASVIIRGGELYIANVGDCRVVLSKRRIATTLTNDHNLSNQYERSRIQSSGGFVHSCNGVWRLQGTLAVSRAIGDLQFKDWIISDPEIHKISLTSDSDFLIMASDGLWDKVSEQEAVDIVSMEKANNAMKCCKKLVDISFSRGNKDDITVMIIYLQNFVVA
ncbi:probable protein phosphatase 2C 2 isoform X1 [Amaranthus tricolor]|uniref:probable protein phosphatase 2C 2 isoform X1 n=1 Tax=Amaranthus tricolor TaxID=29722 RepID=UPI002586CA1D|nr:probable protein phosphatase 2C 2 isoform X1 [Amaranthus tricolor]